MNFGDLKIGQLFEYNGDRYTKSGPFVANSETTGKEAFFRRSQKVVVAGAANSSQESTTTAAATEEVTQLLEQHVIEPLGEVIAALNLTAEQNRRLSQCVNEARHAFCRAVTNLSEKS
jgi:hypothetical protein